MYPARKVFSLLLVGCAQFSFCDFEVDNQIGASLAVSEWGLTGRGVTVAIIDRGIDWRHPDFRNADGSTRIKWILDQSGQNFCAENNPTPIEYSEAEINAALAGNLTLDFRDAIGHGSTTAGLAAGNGNAFADGKYAGVAPEADLLIVKITSEGAAAHNGVAAEAAFNGCYDQALDWINEKATELAQPVVAIINSGVQWGAMDGSSALSKKVLEIFPLDRPGWVMVEGTGDEGNTPSHAKIEYDDSSYSAVSFTRSNATAVTIGIWYSGDLPAEVELVLDDGTSLGPVQPGGIEQTNNITMVNYPAGTQFYPWTSSSSDRTIYLYIADHITSGEIRFRGLQPGTGEAHFYIANSPPTAFTSNLAPGTLTDIATTPSVVVVANHVLRTNYTDIDGIPRSITNQGAIGDIWIGSAEGPTRDGRLAVDVSAPGENVFAPLSFNSGWSQYPSNLVQDGGGWYTRASAVSASAPIALGAVALLLQVNPNLTADAVKTLLRASATSDTFTGPVPNTRWGSGKLNIHAAIQSAIAQMDQLPFTKRVYFANPASNTGKQSFLRFINENNSPVEVEIQAIDDEGENAPSGTLNFQLAAKASLHLNAQDLESGNSDKGISGSLGNGQGKWQLIVSTSSDIEVVSLVRTPDGFLTSLTDVVPINSNGANTVYFANPGSNQTQQSFLRVLNKTAEMASVVLSAIDDAGNPAPGGDISFSLGPNEAKHFNSLDYETGNTSKGLSGSLGDGAGKWHLSLTSERELEVMSMIRTPDGFLTNLSAVVASDLNNDHHIYFANPASNTAQQTFIRIVNTSNNAGTVTISGIDDAGNDAANGSVQFQLDAFSAKQINASDLENGNMNKGLMGSLGDGAGRWQLTVSSSLSLQVMNMIRTADGFVTNLSRTTPKSSPSRNQILVFNPASNVKQSSFLRIVNTSDQAGNMTISGIDDAGNPAPGGDVLISIAARSALEVSAIDLELGKLEAGVTGALGKGFGKWRLSVSSDLDLQIMSLLQTPTGFLTNLSSVTPAAPNSINKN